jgi:site-specific recombinase XerD
LPIAGADESRWASRTSNPLGGIKHVSGGFDPHALPPVCKSMDASVSTYTLLSEFLKSRRQGLSPRSLDYYKCYLTLARSVIGFDVTGQRINDFLGSLQCTGGGKHAYFRSLRAFYNWLYSPRSGYGLNPQDNPMLIVDPPKVGKKILPSLSQEQVDFLIEQAGCVRDKAIISLFVDSGLRLTELANIKV